MAPTPTRAHWQLFPNDRDISEDLFNELVGILAHAGYGELSINSAEQTLTTVDAMTMPSTKMCPREPKDLLEWLVLVKHLAGTLFALWIRNL
jgi:hypothetical protein